MSDRIIVMNKGRIAQIGTPQELYEAPSDLFVANFIGDSNILECRIEKVRGGKASVRLGKQLLAAPAGRLPPGPARLVIRPEHISIGTRKSAASIEGRIDSATYVGSKTEYQIATDAGSLFATQPSGAAQFDAGRTVHLAVSPEAVRLFAVE